MIGVYRMWNTKSRNSYIGSSECIEQRIEQHKANLEKGYFNNTRLFKEDLEKTGIESFSFEILKQLKSQKELESWENFFIGKYDSIDNGYNTILSRRTPVVNIKNIKYEVKQVDLLTKFELAVALKLEENELNEILKDDDLPAIKIGKCKRYIIEDILNYYNSKEIEI